MDHLKKARIGFEAIGNTYPVAENVTREDLRVAGVPCGLFTPPGAGENDIVIYIHGGAFIYGAISSHAPLVSHIARAVERKVLVIDYRLAPEHPFPAGIEDCVAVITALGEQYPHATIGIIGDSAGGNLILATTLVLKETNGLKLQYIIVISPWVDLECKNASYERNKTVDIILARPYLIEAANMYASGWDLAAPILSPVNGDFRGLSPVLILCGTHEILQDDSMNLHQKLLHDGVMAELKLFEGALHVWPFMNIHTVASQTALADMAEFVNRSIVK
ncbi:alpha/beta hydrolase [Fulvivirgaceae bacterium PWU5]|uniref:Alpha/beta hydrolase n=1 Tax=Dawidia cretensis TaxID=2782350 RepID=A0AAP2DTU1_9BACT|nr:alpha/beta hydrolase [Dawidia cretensis]MBT1707333.1 alpha/beta hydrolase [Dawidia cretensis]